MERYDREPGWAGREIDPRLSVVGAPSVGDWAMGRVGACASIGWIG